jgi:hypothetical protein
MSPGPLLTYWQCTADVSVDVSLLSGLDGTWGISNLATDTAPPYRSNVAPSNSVFIGAYNVVIIYTDPAIVDPRTIEVFTGLQFQQREVTLVSQPFPEIRVTPNGGRITVGVLESDVEFPAEFECAGSIVDADCDYVVLCQDEVPADGLPDCICSAAEAAMAGQCSGRAGRLKDDATVLDRLINAQNPAGDLFNETITNEFGAEVTGLNGPENNSIDIDTFRFNVPAGTYDSLRAVVQAGSDAIIAAFIVLEIEDFDSDNDGLSDITETDVSFTDPFNPDTDGDGLQDGDEFLGGEPGDPLSRRTNPLDVDTDNDGLCDGLLAFVPVCVSGEDIDADGIQDDGETDASNADSDRDGLNDNVEILIGDYPGRTDPLDPDSDNDGLLDGVEDRDGDGRFEPGSLETNPLDVDTDDGGVGDGIEVNRGTDPLDPSDDFPVGGEGEGEVGEGEGEIVGEGEGEVGEGEGEIVGEGEGEIVGEGEGEIFGEGEGEIVGEGEGEVVGEGEGEIVGEGEGEIVGEGEGEVIGEGEGEIAGEGEGEGETGGEGEGELPEGLHFKGSAFFTCGAGVASWPAVLLMAGLLRRRRSNTSCHWRNLS